MLSHKNKKQSTQTSQDYFFSAISRGDLKIVKTLLADKTKKIDLNHKDAETGMTAFLKAAEKGHVNILKYLLERDDIEPNITTSYSGLSPLHMAALNGHYDTVKLLLTQQGKYKADPNIRTANNITPLHCAAGNGHMPVVKLLIAAGAETSIKFNNCITPLDIAVQSGHHAVSIFLDGSPQSMHTCLVQRMIALGYHSNPEGICFGLSEVAALAALASEYALSKFYDTIFLLRRLKASDLVNMKNDHENIIQQAEYQALTELNVKSELELNELEKVRFRALTIKYLDKNRNQLTKKQRKREQQYINILSLFDGIELEYRGEKYLHLSTKPFLKAQIHNPTWVSPLIRPNSLDKKGGEIQITMFTGVYSKDELRTYFKTLRTRLRENNKVNQPVAIALDCPDHAISVIYNPNHDSWRIINSEHMPSNLKELKEQTFYGDFDLTDTLAEGLLSKTSDSILRTRILASKNCYIDVKHAIDLWKRDIKPLHDVTPEKVKFKGYMNNYSWLAVASFSADKKKVKSLIRQKADVNGIIIGKYNSSILQEVTHKNQIKIVKILLKTPGGLKINHKDAAGNTALSIAADKGYAQITKLLLRSKVIDLNVHNNDKITPLMYAAIRGYTNIVELLIKDKRTDINLTGKLGATALYMATQNGHFAIVKKLLKADADTSIKAFDHRNLPLDAAIHYGHTDLIYLLIRHEKIKKIMTDLAELNVTSKRYLAIKTLYNSVLDSNNDEEASIIISDFLKLDKEIQSTKCHLASTAYSKIQDEAYHNYITGHSIKEIDIQFKKSILTTTRDNILLNNNFFKTQRQNLFDKLVNFTKHTFSIPM